MPSPRFPEAPYSDIDVFFADYMERLHRAALAVDRTALGRAAALIRDVAARGGTLYVCGNGGSAAIANHMTCDVLKGLRSDTALTPRIVSLSTQVELITAIANDIDYAEIFRYQLSSLARPEDALIAVSSSGDSENVVRALTWAMENGMPTIAMTGFGGGRAARLADVGLHVPCHNYGIVEDAHHALMHVLAQFLRQAHMPAALVGERAF
ncbi:SIS domain-containing protein [Azospirillum sp. ST 5-10]|uniref:SIS domain-containing protein n=1 Tax=unclassified Azospirillum TaxID=2630922 RepID=UPI003F4A2C1B